MKRTIRVAIALGATALALAQPAGAFAAVTPSTFIPPPGCTGDWNTTQSAQFNHAPGTAPGCFVAESHVR
jgi:hypothetical protein